jgi:hypothetical protein
MARNGTNRLHGIAQFSLFATSYLPLFILLIGKQINNNYECLNYGGIDNVSLMLFITKFGLSFILSIIAILGYLGFALTIKNLEKDSDNGFKIRIADVKNKNSESISYIATYIIPFAFLDLSGLFDLFSILFLILIIYRIYINSNLILINPVLNIRYALYEVEYIEDENKRTCFIISKEKYLQESEEIKIYEIGHKMYYSKN